MPVFHPTDKKLYLISFINLRIQFSYHAHQGKYLFVNVKVYSMTYAT